jgi:hypothetical protein
MNRQYCEEDYPVENHEPFLDEIASHAKLPRGVDWNYIAFRIN